VQTFPLVVVPVRPEQLLGDPHRLRIEVHQQKPVLLQPKPTCYPVVADQYQREMTFTPRPAKRPHRSRTLEPGRDTVQ
jgi:hypothetical protein